MVPAALAAQQTVRFNDAARLAPDEPPYVTVSIDGGSMFRFGEPVRVRFAVSEAAHVVVARVDWEGNLTVLHPSGRNRRTLVKGEQEHVIHGTRLGGRGTFVANERNGGTGYVFAIASHDPFDLSRLAQRDFSAWVTGVSVGRPIARYVGDPHRVIARFAQLVLWSDDSPFDYDITYYSVDSPGWVTSFASFYDEPCFDSRSYRSGYTSRYGSESFYCNGMPWGLQHCALGYSYFSWYLGVPIGCVPIHRRPQVATGPNPPVPTPVPDSLRVNPWAPDSISRPNVDKRGTTNGPHVMTAEPATAPVQVDRDRSYSIPPRALRGLRDRGVRDGVSSAAEGSGPAPMPARPAPVSGEPPQIEWVRPPRAATPDRAEDREPPRRGARRDDNAAPRGTTRSWDPPPRAASPVIERERRGGSQDRRGGAASPGQRQDPPPRVIERSPPPRAIERSQAPRAQPARTPPAERKPVEQRKPAEERKPAQQH
jgi:hypothetical protein